MPETTIVLSGCDDRTSLDMDLTDAEVELLERVSAASREASDCSCMPTLFIYPTEKEEVRP